MLRLAKKSIMPSVIMLSIVAPVEVTASHSILLSLGYVSLVYFRLGLGCFVTLRYVTLHYVTLRFVMLCYVRFGWVRLGQVRQVGLG
jgi:uncharacterized membrane protein